MVRRMRRLGVRRLDAALDGAARRPAISAAMDVLLRIIRDLPGSVEYLRRLAA